ncbi:MAG TPA: GGDEF domain-containing protein [Candidatus Eisenbergiella merdipullorum]|uniref:GGDEF domain-containing protein n=1 Tax=Candidatus Eisenbergiella merdipullorum TaxID=2838553 RepID=A0A9D2I510_9FIRM|nr:GGDEF domain-containing protein [Candidatus Eisenbergiella merdipullorum]
MLFYLLSFSVTMCQSLLTVYVLGDDCGIQLYLLALLVPVHYIRMTDHSKAFQNCFIIGVSCACIAGYLISDEIIDDFLHPLGYIDQFSELFFTFKNVVGSLTLLVYVGNTFARGYQKEFQRLADRSSSFEVKAQHDVLTGLKNRRGAESVLTRMYQEWKYTRIPFTVAIGDIDNFKQVNDRYGHEAGDMVLVDLSRLAQGKLPGNAMICRWGGEEFLFAIPGKLEQTCFYLEEIRKTVENHPFLYEGSLCRVTITIGAAQSCQGDSPQELIRKADQQMYEGKRAGRNQLVYGDSERKGKKQNEKDGSALGVSGGPE